MSFYMHLAEDNLPTCAELKRFPKKHTSSTSVMNQHRLDEHKQMFCFLSSLNGSVPGFNNSGGVTALSTIQEKFMFIYKMKKINKIK